MATARKNATIVRDDPSGLDFELICPTCGDLGPAYRQSRNPIPPGSTVSMQYSCPKCFAWFPYEISN